MPELKFIQFLRTVLAKQTGLGVASIWHAVIVTFLHYFSWGLLTMPYVGKLSESFGDRAILADGLVYGVRALFAFGAAPLMGALSDCQGRKVPMLLAVVTTSLPIPFMMTRWFFGLLILSPVFGTTYSSSLAYVADVTTVEHQSRDYGILSAVYGAGMAFSPLFGKYLMDCFGSEAVMAAALFTGLLNILFVVFGVPESFSERDEILMLKKINVNRNNNEKDDENQLILSDFEEAIILSPEENVQIQDVEENNENNNNQTLIPKENEQIFQKKKDVMPSDDKDDSITLNINGVQTQNPLKNSNKFDRTDMDDEMRTTDIFGMLYKVWKDKNLLVLYTIVTLYALPFYGIDDILVVYLRLHMGVEYREVFQMVGIVSVLGITINILLGHIMKIFGAKWVIRLGLLFQFSQLILFSFATRHWMFWVGRILAAMGTIVHAASNTVALDYTGRENPGTVLGTINGIESLCEGVGPAIFGILFYAFQDDSKKPLQMKAISTPFVVGAILYGVAIILTHFIRKET
ncbi:hypothetical protein KR054_007055, partial [Drosophila jambulina]